MKTSASSVAVEAARARSPSGKVAISLDGTKVITLEELDALFDSGSDEIDQYFEEVRDEMIEFIREEKGENGKRIFDLIMVTKYLERIGDHTTNIAEWVEFSITGVHKDSSVMHQEGERNI